MVELEAFRKRIRQQVGAAIPPQSYSQSLGKEGIQFGKLGGILNFTDGHAAYYKQATIKNQQADGNEPLLSDVIWNPPYRLLHP